MPVWIRLGISVARATARITERDGAKPEDTDAVDDKAMAALLVARPIKADSRSDDLTRWCRSRKRFESADYDEFGGPGWALKHTCRWRLCAADFARVTKRLG